MYENVHVAVQNGRDPVGLVPGDATRATWDVDVRVVTTDDGHVDFRGPAVHGKRGDRFLYLTWGAVGDDGRFEMFRRAKLMLDRVEPAVMQRAIDDPRGLTATVQLTDAQGCPRCARVDPPAVKWRAAG